MYQYAPGIAPHLLPVWPSSKSIYTEQVRLCLGALNSVSACQKSMRRFFSNACQVGGTPLIEDTSQLLMIGFWEEESISMWDFAVESVD